MAALLEDKEGVVLPVLEKIGVPVQQLLAQLNAADRKAAEGAGLGRISSRGLAQAAAARSWTQAFKEAADFKDEYVSTEHLLLALACAGKGDPVQTALAAHGCRPRRVVEGIAGGAGIAARDGPESRRANFRRWRSMPRT